jgi:hypothetical protein
MRIEIVYALADKQLILPLNVPEGTTLGQAVQESGMLRQYPELDLGGRNKVGIWSKLVKLDAALREGDRVEIYRPLIADPKEVRKQRAAEGKVMKKGGGEAAGD